MEYIFLILMFAIFIVAVVGICKVFIKAGKAPILAFIPIVNIFVMIEIAGQPSWWILLYFIPLVNVIVAIMVSIEIAKKFGQETGFGLGLAFLPFIFFPILGFGDAQYQQGGGNKYTQKPRTF